MTRRPSRLLFTWSLSCLGLSALLSPVRAQRAFDQVLPDTTLATVLVDDLGLLREVASESTLGQLLADPAFAPMRTEWDLSVEQWATEARESWGSDPLALLDALRGQLTLALLRMAETPEELDDPPLVLAIMAEVGDDPDAFADGFDALVDAWVEEAGLVLKTDVVRELPVAIVVDAEGEQGELRYAFVDGTLVATISSRGVDPADDLGRLIDGLRGESEQLPLAESPAYAESLAAGADQPLVGVRAWVSLRPLWDLARLTQQSAEPGGKTDSEWELVENLGALAVSTLAGASWYADGRSRSAAALTIEETAGVFSVLAAAVASQRCELLDLVPPGVDTAVAADLDLAAAFDASLELATEIDPELGWDLISGLADAEGDLGFHPKDDLIDRTDGQLAFFLSDVPAEESLPGGLVPGGKNFALLVGLNDGEGMQLLIDALIRKHGLNAARSRQEFEGFDLYLIPIMPVTVAYAVLDDLLVVSLSPSLVQDVLRRKAHPELASLAASEDYLAARAELPEQASMLSYARGGDGLRSALKTLLEVQRSGQLMISPVSPPVVLPSELQATLERLELPDPGVVDRYVHGVELAAITIHEDGSLSVAQSTP